MNPSNTRLETQAELGWKKALIFSLLPLLGVLIVLEGTARLIEVWVPPLPVDPGLGFDVRSRLFIPLSDNPRLMVTDPAKEASFRAQRFEIPKPDDRLRIFVLGGSNVNYLHDGLQLLSERLTQRLDADVEMINLGGLAYGSQRLAAIAVEIIGYEPDLAVIYSGHNEFEEIEQLQFTDLRWLGVQRLLYQSAMVRFLRDRAVQLHVEQLRRDHNRKIIESPTVDYKAARRRGFTASQIDERMHFFRDNFERIIVSFQTMHVPVAIGTLASNLWEPDFAAGYENRRARLSALYRAELYDEGMEFADEILRTTARHQATSIENGIIRALGSKRGVPLFDVEAAVRAAEPNGVPGQTLLRDRCHLNERGRQILLDTLEEVIVPILRR